MDLREGVVLGFMINNIFYVGKVLEYLKLVGEGRMCYFKYRVDFFDWGLFFCG